MARLTRGFASNIAPSAQLSLPWMCERNSSKADALIIEVEKATKAASGYGPKITFMTRAIACVEIDEVTDFPEQRSALFERHGLNAGGNHDGPADERAAKRDWRGRRNWSWILRFPMIVGRHGAPVRHRANEKGRPADRPMESCILANSPASLARDARLGMRGGDIFWLSLDSRVLP
jgi:hypothetical protein